jgi:hypothetical protein
MDNTKVNTTLVVKATTTDSDGQPHSSLTIEAVNSNIRLDALVALQESLLESLTAHATRSLGIAKRHAELKLGAAAKPKR